MQAGRPERRIQSRHPVTMRVDLKILAKRDVDAILDGDGYPDLDSPGLALSRPRSGMSGAHSIDMSASGLRLSLDKPVEAGVSAVMDLHLPGLKTVVKALGDVVWCQTHERGAQAGVRLAALDHEGARQIKQFLSQQAS